MAKQIAVVLFLLFGIVKLGCSLECYTCSGDQQQCNLEIDSRSECSAGQNACSSFIRNSPSGMQFFFGCATENDCKAASSVCSYMDKDKKKEPEEMLGVSCNATCCSSDRCVKPYSKDYKPLQCYECNSETECANAKLQKCPDDDNYRCFKLTTEVSYKEANVEVKTFSKGCIRKEQCDPIKRNVFYGTCPNDENCHMSCCEGGMCNVGTNAVVSALAMITCAAFAIFGN